jgi:predicted lipoprotein with Yx(FWY)xxD motif
MAAVDGRSEMGSVGGMNELGGHQLPGVRRRARLAVGAAVMAVSGTALGIGVAVPAASAHPVAATVPHAGKGAVVVKISAKRTSGKTTFKNVLTNTVGVGASLYTAKTCTASCLSVWPPLLMPKGTTVPEGPKGLKGLGTVKDGTRLQVTFNGHKLYTFISDKGASVDGNGVGGFTVIQNA